MKGEVTDKLAALVTAGFGLVAALAWNDAIKAIFKSIFGEQGSLAAMIFYAVLVTLIAVFMTIWVGRAAAKAKGGEQAS
jgi:Flp pilus assembly pilin Flp